MHHTARTAVVAMCCVLCYAPCYVYPAESGGRKSKTSNENTTPQRIQHMGKKKKREIELRYVGIHCMFFEKLKLLRVDGLWVWWVNEYVSIYVRTRYQI